MKRVATQQPTGDEQGAPGCSVPPQGHRAVLAAGRQEATARCQQRTYPDAVTADQGQQAAGHRAWARFRRRRCHLVTRSSARSRSAASSEKLRPAADGAARRTSLLPAGSRRRRSCIRWRSRRRTRLRTTALPTPREIMNPTRDGAATDRTGVRRCTTTEPRAARRPCRTARENSGRRRNREAAGSTSLPAQADSSARPLRRRAARIARPARVRMRSRNPWVLARRRLFGWNVRLLTCGLPAGGGGRARWAGRRDPRQNTPPVGFEPDGACWSGLVSTAACRGCPPAVSVDRRTSPAGGSSAT
jgi:hypothetical protein